MDRVLFAYSSIDLAVPSVAIINRKIGLKTISDIGLEYSSSKSMMTSKWNSLGLLNRISKKYSNFDNSIIELNTKFDLIVKPDNSASSRGITILKKNTPKQILISAFDKAMIEASDDIVVVEEFIVGTEYTVEMIGDAYGNVSVYAVSKKEHTKNTDNNKIAVKLHYNSIPVEYQTAIANFGIKCYKALNFSSSFGHLEIIIKEDGTFSPVEIGARSSGFIASDLVDIVSGTDFMFELISVMHGNEISNGLHSQTDKSSMYYFYDFPNDSELVSDSCLIDFISSDVQSIYHNRDNLVVGKKFLNIDSDNARIGFEILLGPKNVFTEKYIKCAENKMLKNILKVK